MLRMNYLLTYKTFILLFIQVVTLLPWTTKAIFAADHPVVADLIRRGIEENPTIKQEAARLSAAQSISKDVLGNYLPSLSLNARYTVANGGRTIDLPIGDLLNPVYADLNQINAAIRPGSPSFPIIENESIDFLRPHEQETKLSIRQPIINLSIIQGIRAQNQIVLMQQSELKVAIRELTFKIRSTYYGYLQACAAVKIYTMALEQTRQMVRAAERLFSAGVEPESSLSDAQAEDYAARQNLAESTQKQLLAQEGLNLLVNRPLDAPIETVEVDSLMTTFSIDTMAPDSAMIAMALDRREEIQRLSAGCKASHFKIRVEEAAFFPTLGLGIDVGIQGEKYSFDKGCRYSTASAVLEWGLFEGFRRNARVARARNEAIDVEQQYTYAKKQVEFQINEAVQDLRVACASLGTAGQRYKAAKENFDAIDKRFIQGQVSNTDLTAAQAKLTAAALNFSITQFKIVTAQAQWHRAVADEQINLGNRLK